tara:strand:+ start:203 stop:679 length:477 start_codon:yes stop_codon:yes gene_type:complete
MNNNQIITILILSILLGLIRFLLLDDPEFTLIKKERVVKEISDFSVPEIMTEPMAINLDFAKYLFEKDLAIFIDARDVEDFDAGHIQGAINIPYDYYENYEEQISSLDIGKTYIIYCNGEDCSLSMDLADYFFNELLFEKVLIFEAGWPVWRDSKLPS